MVKSNPVNIRMLYLHLIKTAFKLNYEDLDSAYFLSYFFTKYIIYSQTGARKKHIIMPANSGTVTIACIPKYYWYFFGKR